MSHLLHLTNHVCGKKDRENRTEKFANFGKKISKVSLKLDFFRGFKIRFLPAL